LQSIALAAQRVMTRARDHRRRRLGKHFLRADEANTHMRRDPWIDEHKPTLFWSMLQTAETVAKRYNISKESRTNTVFAASSAPPRARPPESSKTRSRR